MEAIGVVSRLSSMSNTKMVLQFDDRILAPFLGHQSELGIVRRFFVTWLFLYIGSLLVYFTFGALDYIIYYVWMGSHLQPSNPDKKPNITREISMSVKSLFVMSGFSTPAEVLIQLGFSKEYTDPAQYGYLYLIVSPVLFIAFSDCIIYFIHRGLHSRLLYRHIHKPHHSFVHTSPFAAFAFHPVDGYMQGVSYHIFVFLFPFHAAVHLVSLIIVSMWTINIHDRVTWGIPGINGAAHHTIHHTTYKSNYGQYFTLWDKLCGTFRDPYTWKDQGAPTLTEKQVYGKHA